MVCTHLTSFIAAQAYAAAGPYAMFFSRERSQSGVGGVQRRCRCSPRGTAPEAPLSLRSQPGGRVLDLPRTVYSSTRETDGEIHSRFMIQSESRFRSRALGLPGSLPRPGSCRHHARGGAGTRITVPHRHTTAQAQVSPDSASGHLQAR